ncbi:shikimate dehydrogenase [Micromonospora sp. NPDC047762]|uniref:shikimate dehydrogenase n=1 Tax=unclassified Micromonospora TaxID=2617518 RepID=UPI0033E8DA49
MLARSDAARVLIGLVGEGIQQSHAPLLHEREAHRQGIPLIYTIIDAAEHGLTASDLPDILRWARLLGYRGLNVTHPFKQEVVRYLDHLSTEARLLGAVNTLVFDGTRACGYNTDSSGFARSFAREFATAPRRLVVQLGAGGAGAAVAHALLSQGVRRLALVDLDPTKAIQLSETLTSQFGAGRVEVGRMDQLTATLARADGLVNATPMGMVHHPGSPVPAADLRSDMWVADIVYRPVDTALLRAARAVGAPILHGGGMNAYQAVAAYEHFTGRPADADAMLADSAELLDAGL